MEVSESFNLTSLTAKYSPSGVTGYGIAAAALADGFQRHPGDFQKPFEEYDWSFRPIVEKIQTAAIAFGLKMFAPTSDVEIRETNELLNSRVEQRPLGQSHFGGQSKG